MTSAFCTWKAKQVHVIYISCLYQQKSAFVNIITIFSKCQTDIFMSYLHQQILQSLPEWCFFMSYLYQQKMFMYQEILL